MTDFVGPARPITANDVAAQANFFKIELAALRAEHQRDEAEQPWLALRRRQEEAETALKDVAGWQAELARIEGQAHELSQRRMLLQDQLEAVRRMEEEQQRRLTQLGARRSSEAMSASGRW